MLANIKSNVVSLSDAREIASTFLDLTQHQANNLAAGFFGIYTHGDTATSVRQNIKNLLPFLWGRVDEATRQQFGIKYGKYTVNNDQDQKKLAREFLNIVSAQSYIPDNLRGAEIQIAVDNLLVAHRAYGNFANEVPFARELARLIGTGVPPQVVKDYVIAVVEVYLTNGNGVSWGGELIYLKLINQFTPDQSVWAMLSFNNDIIASKLQLPLCAEKFNSLLEIIKGKLVGEAALDLMRDIQSFSGPLSKMRDIPQIKRKIATFEKIMG